MASGHVLDPLLSTAEGWDKLILIASRSHWFLLNAVHALSFEGCVRISSGHAYNIYWGEAVSTIDEHSLWMNSWSHCNRRPINLLLTSKYWTCSLRKQLNFSSSKTTLLWLCILRVKSAMILGARHFAELTPTATYTANKLTTESFYPGTPPPN